MIDDKSRRLCNEDLFKASISGIDLESLEYVLSEYCVGIAFDRRKQTFHVYMTNDRGRVNYDKEFCSFDDALHDARENYELLMGFLGCGSRKDKTIKKTTAKEVSITPVSYPTNDSSNSAFGYVASTHLGVPVVPLARRAVGANYKRVRVMSPTPGKRYAIGIRFLRSDSGLTVYDSAKGERQAEHKPVVNGKNDKKKRRRKPKRFV